MTLHEFHQADGWYFTRLDDGSVFIHSKNAGLGNRRHTIPPNEWVSVVAAVAPNHGSAEEHAAAERLHAARTDPKPETP